MQRPGSAGRLAVLVHWAGAHRPARARDGAVCGAISRLGEGKPLSGRSALTGAASGSRSWSSSARVAVQETRGGVCRRALTVRDRPGLREPPRFLGLPPRSRFWVSARGDPAGVGLCVRWRGFFVPLFQGGFSMTNRPFHEMPPIQCPVCGRAARVLVCEETRPPTGPAKGGEGWTVAGRLVSLVSCIVGSGSGVCGCAAPARAAGLAVVAEGVSAVMRS